MALDKKEVFKSALKLGGAACTSFTIDKLIKDNVSVSTIPGRIAIGIGGSLIGLIISDKAEEYISKEFDNINRSFFGKDDIKKEKTNG